MTEKERLKQVVKGIVRENSATLDRAKERFRAGEIDRAKYRFIIQRRQASTKEAQRIWRLMYR
jgi:uncharacterized membrane protein